MKWWQIVLLTLAGVAVASYLLFFVVLLIVGAKLK